jgi:polysaccharide biosynthesis/export protein
VQELAAALTRDYSADLRNPRLSVVLKSFAPTRIYVGGEVNTPGEFITVGPTLTLSQAIARAGGLKFTTSDESKVFVIRRGPNDVPEFLSTRFNAVMWAQDPSADVRLAPYDVVFVPRSGIAEVYRFFETYLLQFVPVSWGFSYVVGAGGGGGSTIVPVTTGTTTR